MLAQTPLILQQNTLITFHPISPYILIYTPTIFHFFDWNMTFPQAFNLL